MASTGAQEEYDAMFSQRSSRQNHPEDDPSSANLSDDDDTLSITSSNAAENEASLAETAYPSAPTHSSARSRSYLPNQRSYNNTGPKGVIADAQAFREAQSAHRASVSANRDFNPAAQQPYIENLSINDSAYEDDERAKDEEDLLLEENEEGYEGEQDDFMLQWRQSRLQELRGKSVIASNSAAERFGMGRGAKLVYEGLTAVDGEGFLEIVDGSPRDVTVVVFVWDDMVCLRNSSFSKLNLSRIRLLIAFLRQSEVSSMVEDCVRQMARKHKTTRFIKLHYQDAEMEPAGVPAVLAYRAGDKFAGLVPVVDEIPDDADLSPETLENLFKRYVLLCKTGSVDARCATNQAYAQASNLVEQLLGIWLISITSPPVLVDCFYASFQMIPNKVPRCCPAFDLFPSCTISDRYSFGTYVSSFSPR